MLGNFTYCNPTKLYFGKDALDGLNAELSKYGKNVLLVYGGGSVKKNGIYDKVVSVLKANGMKRYLPLFILLLLLCSWILSSCGTRDNENILQAMCGRPPRVATSCSTLQAMWFCITEAIPGPIPNSDILICLQMRLQRCSEGML